MLDYKVLIMDEARAAAYREEFVKLLIDTGISKILVKNGITQEDMSNILELKAGEKGIASQVMALTHFYGATDLRPRGVDSSWMRAQRDKMPIHIYGFNSGPKAKVTAH